MEWLNAFVVSVKLKEYFTENVTYKCIKSKAELEQNIDGSWSIKKLILE